MGSKYIIRTNEERNFPLETIKYTDYYIHNIIDYIKIRILKRGKIIFIRKNFF